MSNVSLQIGGRSYSVACAAGEEDHVARLGRVINEKVQSMGGGHTEVRQLLFAALILADELHEARPRRRITPLRSKRLPSGSKNAPRPLRARPQPPIYSFDGYCPVRTDRTSLRL